MAGSVRDCVREVGGRRREGGWAEKKSEAAGRAG